MTDNLKRERFFQIRLTAAEADELHKYCNERGLKASSYARNLILASIRGAAPDAPIRIAGGSAAAQQTTQDE